MEKVCKNSRILKILDCIIIFNWLKIPLKGAVDSGSCFTIYFFILIFLYMECPWCADGVS